MVPVANSKESSLSVLLLLLLVCMYFDRDSNIRTMKLVLAILFFTGLLSVANSQCRRGCDLALASYYVWRGVNLSFISTVTQTPIQTILSYNPHIPNQESLLFDSRLNIPFSCDCIRDGLFLGHVFSYSVNPGDTYDTVAETYYANLTTARWLQRFNAYPELNISDTLSGVVLNVTVNCSCGDRNIDSRYGLFVTYPLRDNESLASVASVASLNISLVGRYNMEASGSRLLYIPGRDQNGSYRPLSTSTHEQPRLSGGVIAVISVACVVGILLLASCIYFMVRRKQKAGKIKLLSAPASGLKNVALAVLTGFTVDKSVEFSYEELANATDDFSSANKIGEGGFGAVYYAELQGEKAAIKKMDMQASKEFLAELKVLTHVHHHNLVRLIGYCVEGSLFLVYEYIGNGNLGQNLRDSGREPLPWSTRLQIALDSARGLEYIHEHTVPMYIHRDIKPANILIDDNFHGKVADFGLAKLTEVGSKLMPTARLVGTFGYMPPEYVQYGDVSPKVDVYAFGVVLYELISAKEAIVKGDSAADLKGLVALFDEAFNNNLDGTGEVQKLVDPRLGDNYPLDSVQKMAELARVCTHENPQLRPSMKSVVVALMTLSSTTVDMNVGSFYEKRGENLMSGR